MNQVLGDSETPNNMESETELSAPRENLKYDDSSIEVIRKRIFSPLEKEAADSAKDDRLSYLTNPNSTLPLMNMSDLTLRVQDFAR